MTEDRRVWLVVTGSYSDYRVECAAASEADAKQIAATINAWWRSYEDAHVKSVPLVTPPVHRVTIYMVSVTVWDDGLIQHHQLWQDARWPWEYEASRPVRWRWVRAPMHEGKGGRLDVTGTDRELVFRVASDRAAMIHADPVLARKTEATG